MIDRDEPDADPEDWLEPEDLTDEELGVGETWPPEVLAAARRRRQQASEQWRYLPDDPLPVSPAVAPEQVATVLRAVRWRGRFSQRALAEAAQIPRSSVARMEAAESSDPRLSTLVRVAGTIGLHLALVDDEGTHLAVPFEQTGFTDAADRRLPAHQQTLDTRVSGWWGEGRYHRKGRPLRAPARTSVGTPRRSAVRRHGPTEPPERQHPGLHADEAADAE